MLQSIGFGSALIAAIGPPKMAVMQPIELGCALIAEMQLGPEVVAEPSQVAVAQPIELGSAPIAEMQSVPVAPNLLMSMR